MPLNFDIRMTPSYIAEMLIAIEADERIGSVCGKLLQMTEDWTATDRIDTTGLILLPTLIPQSRGNGESDVGQYDAEPRIFGAQGAAPLYRRAMLEDIAFEGQFFDERYFMWYEDVDLDWRAYLRGWDCRFAARAVAYHMGHSQAERQNAFHVRTTVRNRWLMLLTNLSSAELRRYWRPMVQYELALLRYAARTGFVPAYLHAVAQTASSPAYISRKRTWVRRRAMRSVEVKEP